MKPLFKRNVSIWLHVVSKSNQSLGHCRVLVSLFPQASTLWINIDWSWSRERAALRWFWTSSSTKESSTKRVTMKSWLCLPLSRRWGRSTLVAWKLVDAAKTSSTKSLWNMSHSSLMSSKESKCCGEFLAKTHSLPEQHIVFYTLTMGEYAMPLGFF